MRARFQRSTSQRTRQKFCAWDFWGSPLNEFLIQDDIQGQAYCWRAYQCEAEGRGFIEEEWFTISADKVLEAENEFVDDFRMFLWISKVLAFFMLRLCQWSLAFLLFIYTTWRQFYSCRVCFNHEINIQRFLAYKDCSQWMKIAVSEVIFYYGPLKGFGVTSVRFCNFVNGFTGTSPSSLSFALYSSWNRGSFASMAMWCKA